MARVDGKAVGVGNSRLMERQNVSWLPCELPGTIVHVTIDGFYAGHIVISDLPKPDAKDAIAGLKALGVKEYRDAYRRRQRGGSHRGGRAGTGRIPRGAAAG